MASNHCVTFGFYTYKSNSLGLVKVIKILYSPENLIRTVQESRLWFVREQQIIGNSANGLISACSLSLDATKRVQ